MEIQKKHIYWGLTALAVVGIGAYLYSNRLPSQKDIKVSADGTNEDEEKDICEETKEAVEEAKKESEFHGGRGGRGWRGRGWGGRGWGGWGGYGYPAYGGYGGNCMVKDANGTVAVAPCGMELDLG